MPRRHRAVVMLAALTTFALGVGSPGAVAAAPPSVTTIHETFVDTTRPTPASGALPALPSRTLETTITFPSGARGRRPLIVLAHGLNGNPGKLTDLMGTWARAGYVVAAPRFPRSSNETGGDFTDVVNQPRDVSFVIDEVVRLSKRRSSPLSRRVDARRIGVGGFSLGGWTTYGLLFHPCCRDDRIDAAILMAAVVGGFSGGDYAFRPVPVLLVHGDADPLYSQSTRVYPQLAPPKWFVTLHGAGHAAPFEDALDPTDELVREVTTDFWDATLAHRRGALDRLQRAIEAAGNAAELAAEPGPFPTTSSTSSSRKASGTS